MDASGVGTAAVAARPMERVGRAGALALIIVQAGWILAAMDYSIYNFALPLIIDEFKIDLPTAGLIFFLSLQGTFIGSLVVPILADYVGRTKAMIGNILLYALTTGAVAFAPAAWFLTIARFFVNFGVGAEQPVGATYISEEWDPKSRGRAMGFMQSGFAIGSLLASAMLVVVGTTLGWRAMFLIGILPALLVVAIRLWLPETRKWTALQEQKQHAPATVPVGERGFTLAQLFAPDLRKLTIIGTILLFVGNSGSGGIFAWAPVFLKSERGLDIGTVGWFGIVLSLGLLAGYNSWGFVADAFGRRPGFAFYFLMGILAVPVFAGVTDQVALVIATFFVGAMAGGQFAGFVTYLSEIFPTRARATGIGWCMGIGLFFWALVPYLMGVMAPGTNFAPLFAISSPAVYVVGLLTLLWAPETKGRELA